MTPSLRSAARALFLLAFLPPIFAGILAALLG